MLVPRVATAALALALSSASVAADDPPGAGRALVGPCSYGAPLERATILRAETLRESLRLALRLGGFAVAHEAALPARTLAPAWTPAARLLGLAPDGALVVEVVFDGELTAIVHDPELPEPERTPVADSDDDLLALAEAVVARIAARRGRQLLALEVEGPLDPDALELAHALDAGFADRLRWIDHLLGLLEGDDQSADLAGTLAVACALHAAFATRTDELVCQRWFGRALGFAELAARGTGPPGQRLRAEIAALAARFGAGLAVRAPDDPLTAGGRAWRAFDTLSFEDTPRCPPIESLFELLLHADHTLELRGSAAARDAFAAAYPWPLDAGLALARRTSTSQRAHFDSALFFDRRVHPDDFARELETLSLALDFEDAFARAAAAVAACVESGRGWDLLDNEGAGARAGGAVGDVEAALVLGWIEQLERVARAESGDGTDAPRFSRALGLDLSELLGDLTSRGQQYVQLRWTRVNNIGSGEAPELVEALLARYGEHRRVVARHRPGLPHWGRARSALEDELDARWNKLRAAARAGRHAAARDELVPLLERLAPNDDRLYRGPSPFYWRWRFDSPAFEVFVQAGEIDEGLRRVAAARDEGFSSERFRFTALYFRRDDLSGLGELFGPGSGSTIDHWTSQEAAFRRGDAAEMIRIAEGFQFGADVALTSGQALGELLLAPDDDEAWQRFETAFAVLLESSHGHTAYAHHWQALLDARLGHDPRWEQLSQRVELARWATVARSLGELWSPPRPERAAALHAELAAITDARFRPDDPNLYRDMLFVHALEQEHRAFAHRVLAETDGLRDAGRTAELLAGGALLERAATLLRMSRALTAQSEGGGKYSELELRFASQLVWMGAEPAALAELVARIPDVRRLLFGSSVERAFALATGSRAALTQLLAHWHDGEDHAFLEIFGRVDADVPALSAAALAAGDERTAALLGIEHALAGGSLAPLRPFLADDAESRRWIDTNAPDRDTAERWRGELGGGAAAAEPRTRLGTAALPGVVDVLNP